MTTTVRVNTATGAKELKAMLDTGATLNFISQFAVKELRLTASDATAPSIHSICGHSVRTYQNHSLQLQVQDSEGQTALTTGDFLAADIIGYDIVIGLPWLKRNGVKLDPASGTWRLPVAQPSPPQLIGAAAFIANIRREKLQPLLMDIQDMRGESPSLAGIQAGDAKHPIPEKYIDLADVFSSEEADKLPEHGPQDHAIETHDGAEPPFGPLYNLSVTELETLRAYIDENLKRGFIRPSTSPAGAPILFVKKKDGSLRLCVDYRGLNRITIKNRYPLPLISEALDRLVGARVYTKLDLRAAYTRIRIKEGDEWKTAFRTRFGHFEYLVLPFGLSNAPATFQSFINYILRDFLDVFCIVYLDDILIYSKSRKEHTQHVRMVLERLRKHKLYVNLKKCEFDTTEVGFVGFIVRPDGVAMEPSRVDAVRGWEEPKTRRELQVFLGFANFYRRFVHAFSKIARPLNNLLKGGKRSRTHTPFELTESAKQAFRELKEAFTTAPVLRHFDPDLPIRVETDASGHGLSGILSQPNPNQEQAHYHPVAFWSRGMTQAERNYGTGDTEMLAIVSACRQWRHYLEGAKHPVTVITDHANLCTFFTTKQLTRRHARWWEQLSGFDIKLQYRQGKLNPADGLSRRPDYETVTREDLNDLWKKLYHGGKDPDAPTARPSGSEIRLGECILAAIVTTETQATRKSVALAAVNEEPYGDEAPTLLRELISLAQKTDPLGQRVMDHLAGRTRSDRGAAEEYDNWHDVEGTLYRKGRLYVPPYGSARSEILRRNHDDPHAGQFGKNRTLELLQRKYYWPGMAKEVKRYVLTCTACTRIKPPRHKAYGELQSLQKPSGPFKNLTMDFITDLPPSERLGRVYDAILVVVDRYTKLARYVPARKTMNAEELAQSFLDAVLKDFGTPESIVSDRGPVFTASFWSALCYYCKIRRNLSSAFHPQTDGQTERQNQTLEQYLRAYINYQQDDWAAWLSLAEFAYNNSRHESTGTTPFFAAYGVHPEWGADPRLNDVDVPAAKERAAAMSETRTELEKRLEHAVKTQTKYYDEKHKPRQYAPGDMVWLSGKNIQSRRPSKKLDNKFHGPFRILKVIGEQAYRLELPATMHIHPVFHVSLLEPYKPDPARAEPPPPLPIEVDGEERWQVSEVLDSRIHRNKLQYLVRWEGFSDKDDQWLDAREIAHITNLLDAFHKAYPHKPSADKPKPRRKHNNRRDRKAKTKT